MVTVVLEKFLEAVSWSILLPLSLDNFLSYLHELIHCFEVLGSLYGV